MNQSEIFAFNGLTKLISFNLGNNAYYWLLDTGASLSIIRKESLPQNIDIFRNNVLVNGIGGQIHSQGHVYLTLSSDNGESFKHKFHIFKNLPLKADGIIGLDFFEQVSSKNKFRDESFNTTTK